MTDIWVCGTCSSINRQRDSRCYKCGAKQEGATGALADVRTGLALQSRVRVRYRSSLLWAIIAAAFILAVAVLGIVTLLLSLDAMAYLRDQVGAALSTGTLDRAELVRRSAPAVVPGLARTVSAIGALLFFAVWLSRVVTNIPSLGGGTPVTTPAKAFVYPFIPIVNLVKVPPMIQDALYRLDPKAGGLFMILLAWVGLVGSAIVSFVMNWWVNLRVASVARNARTLGEAIADIRSAFDMLYLVEIVTTLMISAGAVILVMVMFRIEARARTRDREIRKAALASVTAAGAAAATLPAATMPAATRPEAPPVSAPQPATAGPHLIVTVGADGALTAELEGESEPVTLESLEAASAALYRANGSAAVRVTTPDADLRAVADQTFGVLSRAGVPTTLEP